MSSKIHYVKPEKIDPAQTFRHGVSKEVAQEFPPLVQTVLSLENACRMDINKAQIAKAVEAFQRFPGDTGSSEVQIAVLTQKISYLTEHMQQHKKDKHSMRGLVGLVNKRRKLLKYLKRKDVQKCKAVVSALGIRFK